MINRSEKLNNVRYDIRGKLVDIASEMEERGESIIKLNIGNLAPYGFDAPKELFDDIIRNLKNAQGYTDSRGIFSARKAIMQFYQLQGLKNLDVNDIFLGNGVSELIINVMQALCNPGDEILLPSPVYPLWSAAVTLAGGKVVHYMCDESADWLPDIEDMKKKVSDRTKAIVIINPNNPTGAVYGIDVLKEIVEIARQNKLMLLSDEIYDHLVMDDIKFTSIASLAPDLFCATFNGLSKSYRATGFRSGWVVFSGEKEAARDFIEGVYLLSSMRLCSNAPAQYIIQTCVGGYQSIKEFVEPGGRIYDQREFMFNAIENIPGLTVVKPKAAFYMFPKFDKAKLGYEKDNKMAIDLLRREKVLVVPGSGFDYPGNSHFRMTYLPDVTTLATVAKRFSRFF